MVGPDAVLVWHPHWPCPVGSILRQQQHGGGDPTMRVVDGRHFLGMRTPMGPATLLVEPLGDAVRLEAWGDGAQWAVDHGPALLGADDDLSHFDTLSESLAHPLVAEARRRRPDHRFGASHRLWEVLVPAVIEQKVTGQEAFAGFRKLVHRFGERAPGPGQELRLWVQPSPQRVRTIPSWEWLALHVDPARSRPLVRAAAVASSLERVTREAADRQLRSLPGIGEWTAAEVRSRVFGDPDAVSFGDYHIAKDIGVAVAGTPWTDDQMRAFLEPWRPQRNRVVSLVHGLAGGRPRHGPRMAPRTHLPAR